MGLLKTKTQAMEFPKAHLIRENPMGSETDLFTANTPSLKAKLDHYARDSQLFNWGQSRKPHE
jgi:hypothetical protein